MTRNVTDRITQAENEVLDHLRFHIEERYAEVQNASAVLPSDAPVQLMLRGYADALIDITAMLEHL